MSSEMGCAFEPTTVAVFGEEEIAVGDSANVIHLFSIGAADALVDAGDVVCVCVNCYSCCCGCWCDGRFRYNE